jgi:hypothetical protein
MIGSFVAGLLAKVGPPRVVYSASLVTGSGGGQEARAVQVSKGSAESAQSADWRQAENFADSADSAEGIARS